MKNNIIKFLAINQHKKSQAQSTMRKDPNWEKKFFLNPETSHLNKDSKTSKNHKALKGGNETAFIPREHSNQVEG